MTENQIKWAAQHDWFVSSLNDTVIVEDISVDMDRKVYIEKKEFNNFKELRRWAGY